MDANLPPTGTAGDARALYQLVLIQGSGAYEKLKLVLPRTVGMVGGPVLPRQAPLAEVEEWADGRLAYVLNDIGLIKRVEAVLDGTSAASKLRSMRDKNYATLYRTDVIRPPVQSEETVELTGQEALETLQCFLTSLLNYSNLDLRS